MSKPNLNVTEEVEHVTKLFNTFIYQMRLEHEEGDILVGMLLSTIFYQHQLKMPFEVLQEMFFNLRMSVDDAVGMEAEAQKEREEVAKAKEEFQKAKELEEQEGEEEEVDGTA